MLFIDIDYFVEGKKFSELLDVELKFSQFITIVEVTHNININYYEVFQYEQQPEGGDAADDEQPEQAEYKGDERPEYGAECCHACGTNVPARRSGGKDKKKTGVHCERRSEYNPKKPG